MFVGEFDNTNTRIEVTKWYSINGVPAIEDVYHKGKMFMPVSAKLIFVDGDCTDLFLSGKLIKVNGEASDRVTTVPGIHVWDQSNWPEWLHELHALAYSELQATTIRA